LVTHFCAPVFVFLAGTGAFLSTSRGKTKKELAAFLLSRGVWLVFLDLFFVHTFGGSTSITTYFMATSFGLWAILHSGDILEPLPGVHFVPGYPLVPWIGVMAAGYGFGTLLLRPQDERRKWLLGLGIGLTLTFIVIRATNVYGDPHAWVIQKTGVFTFFSFINCEKYPPSLLYLLMTLGPAIIALGLFERISYPLSRPIVILGRVPLFFYLLHLVVIHPLAIAFAYARYGQADWMFKNVTVPTNSVLPYPQGYGTAQL
jgi:uncharacterized membrane protein